MRTVLLTAVAAIVLAALPAAANAGTVTRSDGEIRFAPGPGERNGVVVSLVDRGSEYEFVDIATSVSAGARCRPGPPANDGVRGARCSAAGVTRIIVDLGDRDDGLSVAYRGGAPVAARGGPGTDAGLYSLASGVDVVLTLDGVPDDGPDDRGDNFGADFENASGGPANDTVAGNAANNRLAGGDGRDVIGGGAGDDVIQSDEMIDTSDEPAGGPAGVPDWISCGDGHDIVDGDVADVVADDCEVVARNGVIDGTNGDDLIVGFREGLTISGSAGDDYLAGLGSDTLEGRSGNDVLRGGAGDRASSLRGGSGNDSIQGASAKDRIAGGYGNDRIWGLAGNDRLDGGAGRDVLSGGAGHDYIVSKERGSERDTVVCGPGRDRVLADRNDNVARDCERVTRR